MKTTTSFKTNRLLCRVTGIEDAPFILQLLNTEKWLLNIGDRNVHTEAEAKAYIENRMLPQLDRLGYGNYTMILKKEGVKIGTVGLYDREGLEGVDIGFALLPEFYSKGYAFEACTQLLALAKNTWKIKTVKAITLPSNKPSQRLLERLGLTFIKIIHLPNDSEALMLYSN